MVTGFDDTVGEAGRLFEKRFGRRPRFAASAPGRVNLIGEHTDYNDGYVLPMAIDRWAVVVADRAAAGGPSTLCGPDLGEEVTVDVTGPLAPRPGGAGSFANYLLGVIDQFKGGHEIPNLDLLLTSSVPLGAGLASSAAVEVATGVLLQQVLGVDLGPLELALLCQRAEHAFPGTPCGLMDMFVATHAEPGHALLIDCRTRRSRPVPMPQRVSVLIADTGVRHELAEGAYADRRRTCAEAARKLGVPALRDALAGGLAASKLDDVHRRRARHVIDENQRTLVAAAALATGDLEALGEVMFDGHASLRDLFEVSCPELDVLVEAAAALRGDGGVIGARMTGAGFGGCVVVLGRPETTTRVAETLRRRFAERFGRRPECFAVTAAGGARTITL